MTIAVIEQATSTVLLTEDGLFKCSHENADIEPPCCNGRDCACRGLYGVHCPDCDNTDMTDEDRVSILEGALDE